MWVSTWGLVPKAPALISHTTEIMTLGCGDSWAAPVVMRKMYSHIPGARASRGLRSAVGTLAGTMAVAPTNLCLHFLVVTAEVLATSLRTVLHKPIQVNCIQSWPPGTRPCCDAACRKCPDLQLLRKSSCTATSPGASVVFLTYFHLRVVASYWLPGRCFLGN